MANDPPKREGGVHTSAEEVLSDQCQVHSCDILL